MRASIRDQLQKIKVFGHEMKEEMLVSFLIVLVGFASYGLGRLSYEANDQSEIRIIQNSSYAVQAVSGIENAESMEESSQSGQVVASKNGTKYHFPWCGGAKQISEKNKITFGSIEEARKAGYLPASNCKGLK